MDEKDLIDWLGEPDEIVAGSPRSRAWFCSTCCKLHTFPEPVECPAPCSECGGIFFERR